MGCGKDEHRPDKIGFVLDYLLKGLGLVSESESRIITNPIVVLREVTPGALDGPDAWDIVYGLCSKGMPVCRISLSGNTVTVF